MTPYEMYVRLMPHANKVFRLVHKDMPPSVYEVKDFVEAARNGNLKKLNGYIKTFGKAIIDETVDEQFVGFWEATALTAAAYAGQADCVRALIKANVDVNKPCSVGRTALMATVRKDCMECFNLLMQAGANIDQQDENKETALMLASRYNDHSEMIKSLLLAGADTELEDNQGETVWKIKNWSSPNAERILADWAENGKSYMAERRAQQQQKDFAALTVRGIEEPLRVKSASLKLRAPPQRV